jgi:D-alanine-D-alanine ligase
MAITVGLTYDLRDDYLKEGFTEEEVAEFDKPQTIEGLERALLSLGFQTERIGNIKELTKSLVSGKRWDIVFNICEGIYGIGREAQVPALLDAYQIPYIFSDPLVLTLTLHKGMTKHVVRDCNIPTADFYIVEKPEDAGKINMPFPLFAKPVAEGTGKGISSKSKINNKEELTEVCSFLLKQFKQPVLVETFLPGREFTIGIIGTGDKARVVGMMEVILGQNAESNCYSYFNKENYLDHIDYIGVAEIDAAKCAEVALNAWKCLNCRDGGRIDIRYDANEIPNFIEVNPLAGLNYIHSDLPILFYKTGGTFEQLIGMIMQSALERNGMI